MSVQMAIRRDFNHLAATPQPVILCACCHQVMRAHWQPGILDAMPGHWSVTCPTDTARCDLAGFTMAADSYPPEDLATYRLTGRKRRIALLDGMVG